jgi:hypothetical protein
MRRQRVQKLTVNASRIGETRRVAAHTAREAARKATQYAHKGFRVAVTTEAGDLRMTCIPRSRGSEKLAVANCDVEPTFKQQIKGLAGARLRSRRGPRLPVSHRKTRRR